MHFLINVIKNILDNQRINLIDIGANGGLEPNWQTIDKFIHVLMFDPDPDAKQIPCDSYTWYQHAVGKISEEKRFYICRETGRSSFYYPNKDFLNLFQNSERKDVIQQSIVSVQSLDSIISKTDYSVDFIKIDTQGSELDIITGGKNTIKEHVLGLEIEVEFSQLYKNVPLFDEISKQLKEYGFEFYDFTNLCRWERNEYNQFGQIVFGDALFLRSPENLDTFLNTIDNEEIEKKIKAYLVICLLYKKYDIAEIVIDKYRDKYETLNKIRSDIFSLMKKRKYLEYSLRLYAKILRLFGYTPILLPK